MATPTETANPIITMLASGVVGIAITMLVFFIKDYFTSRDKKATTGESERKEFVTAIHELKIEMTKLEGERKADYKEMKTQLDIYTRENNKLAGKMEQNTEQLSTCNKLLDHVSRQSKRLFSVVIPIQKDVVALKARVSKMQNG